MKKLPLISVIITDCNYGSYVGQAIESVLHQTYKNIELIVINDGSTDSSDEVIKRYVTDNTTINYIKQKNMGANISRNKGLAMARGEYIFLLDADNWLNPDHIEGMYKTAIKNNADVVYGDLQHFGNQQDRFVVSEFDMDLLKVSNFIDTSSLVKRKWTKENKFDEHLNRGVRQDWDFFLGLALKGAKIVKDPNISLNYRTHDKQNGSRFSSISKINQFCDSYAHITEKYAKQYPGQFGPYVKFTNDLVLKHAAMQKILIENQELKSAVERLTQERAQIRASWTFRLGRMLIAPISAARKLTAKAGRALQWPKLRLRAPKITIVVPVYDDWQTLSECIASLKRHARSRRVTRVIFINDQGPKARYMETSIQKAIRGTKKFVYYSNPTNLGFIKTCNRAAYELDGTNNDILLLNSDTKLTHGAVQELHKALYSKESIGCVSPRSNHATVFSVPFEAAHDAEYPPEKSYSLYLKIRRHLRPYYVTPTAHGFCMLIRRDVIKRYGLFDEAYGRGYGEENDFCMRIRAHGIQSVVANRAYVFHAGSKSFGSKDRERLVARNHKTLLKRYPEYDELVGSYIRDVVVPEQLLLR